MLFFSYDLGTTALKSAIVDESWRVVAISTQEYSYHMPTPGNVEMDTHSYWEALLRGTHQVIVKSSVIPNDIHAVCFNSQAQTFIPIDRYGKPLHPAIVWLDNRAKALASYWQNEWLTQSDYQRITGYPWIPAGFTIFKIAWLQENNPSILAITWKFLWLPDYLIFLLTGETTTDYVTARMGGMYNFRTQQWEDKLLKFAEIGISQLPKVVPPGTIAGCLRSEVAYELGIPKGIPVCTGANDQLISAIGAGNIDYMHYHSNFIAGDNFLSKQRVTWSTWYLQPSQIGVYGDPTVASLETGKVIFDSACTRSLILEGILVF